MGLILHTNSWVTIAEADTYLNDKCNASAWSTCTQKESFLVTAFRTIYSHPGISIEKTSTNERVKWAQIEMAYWLLQHDKDNDIREALQVMGVTSAKADDTQETYNCKFLLPPVVENLIIDFVSGIQIGHMKRKIKHYL
jgi:hypothetical protein